MPKILDIHNTCCGCGACAATCPLNCISMVADNYGFLYPSVGSSCVECGKCNVSCPSINSLDKIEPKKAFWAQSNCRDMRMASSSGGLFSEIALYVLSMGGAIYGAGFSEDYKSVRHLRIDSAENLGSILGSKYLQSVLSKEIYCSIKCDLERGTLVLFSGTSCQVAALKCFLGPLGLSERLLCADVICHGVPTPKLWSMYCDYKSQSENIAISSVDFRNKETGWSSYSISFYNENKRDHSSLYQDDWYFKCFLNNASLRPSCFRCSTKCLCESDITLGDFWGFSSFYPELPNDETGISAVLINTDSGCSMFREIEKTLTYGETESLTIYAGNPCLKDCVAPYKHYDSFMSDIASNTPIQEMISKWTFKKSLTTILKEYAVRILRKIEKVIWV